MTYEFKLPDIGEGVVEGEVVRWLVQEGDPVREDQPMVEIMTDKATVEIPSPRAGRVGRRMYAEGQLCPVGKVLITIETDGAAAATTSLRPATEAAGAGAAHEGRAAGGGAPNGGGAARANGDKAVSVLATPATRKLARDSGVDLRAVAGTGPAGRLAILCTPRIATSG